MARIPVFTFNIGAVGDRVKKDGLGWTIDLNADTSKILEKMQEISRNKEEYQKIKANFDKYKFKTIEEMQKYYEELYNKIEVKEENRIANIYMFMDYRKQTKELEFSQYQAQYGYVIHRYEMMRRTKLWKVAKKIKSKLKGD